jgi:hypothetical protein
MATRTPGPWEIHHWGDCEADIHGSDGTLVCSMRDGDTSQEDSDASDADAALIAAAPSLLEGIDQVCAALETLMAQHGDSMSEDDRRSRYEALGSARRAQANAEGYATWEEAVNAWTEA